MAYDGYHSSASPYPPGNMNLNLNSDPSDPHQYPANPPYPSNSYEPDRLDMPQPQMPAPGSPPASMDAETPRPQNVAQGYGYLNEAVSSAVHHANSANSSEYLSPDVLSQITATVIQQLKATGLGNLQGPPSSVPPPPRSQSQQPSWPAGSDPAARPHSESPPNVSQRGDQMPQVNLMSRSFESTQPYANRPPPLSSGYASDTRATPKPPRESQSSRRESMSSHGSQKMERPKPPSRDATVVEMTTLEKIWGKLFEDGKPTKRLGQFLRGIAMHLVRPEPDGKVHID